MSELDDLRAEVEGLREVEAGLRSALERTEANFRLAVQGKPVRDMAETLAENAAALLAPSPAATREATCLCGDVLRPGFGWHSCNARPAPVSSGEAAS